MGYHHLYSSVFDGSDGVELEARNERATLHNLIPWSATGRLQLMPKDGVSFNGTVWVLQYHAGQTLGVCLHRHLFFYVP